MKLDTTPEVTVDPAVLDTIPTHIREAMSPQMRDVVLVQSARAAESREAADEAFAEAGETERARAEYRAERAYWNQGGPSMAATADTRIRVAGVDVPVRIHRPSAEAVLPGIVYLHGGGFRLGDLDTHDRIARVIAADSGAAVIAVDYSLSPEAVFPQALRECAAIIDQLTRRGDEHGIDGSRLAVAGDSAGAMLSLGAALLLRDDPDSVDAEPGSFAAIRALVLFYGGHGLQDSASRRLFGGSWDGMGPEALKSLTSVHYSSSADAESPYANHLGADLTGLPPTFVAAAGLDPLRDDSRALVTLLSAADADVEYVEYPHVLHSFLHFGRMLDEANDALSKSAAFATAQLTAPPA